MSSPSAGVQAYIKKAAPDADYQGTAIFGTHNRILLSYSITKMISGLCKTRWVERHNNFSTTLELYPFLVKTWNEICYPTSETNSRDWKWDSESRSMATGLSHTFASFEHIVTFIIAKEVLEPI